MQLNNAMDDGIFSKIESLQDPKDLQPKNQAIIYF